MLICCSYAGKGWYNLNESNYETYCFSKMKSLLVVTRFMMEDTLRSLVLDNHSKYVAFVNAACSTKVILPALRLPKSPPTALKLLFKKAADVVQENLMQSLAYVSSILVLAVESEAMTFTGMCECREMCCVELVAPVTADNGLNSLKS